MLSIYSLGQNGTLQCPHAPPHTRASLTPPGNPGCLTRRALAVGTLKTEKQPQLQFSECTKSSGCQSSQKSVTVDANWRWTHKLGEATNCYTGNQWDQTLCPDPATCAKNCAIEGADDEYAGTYGIKTTGNQLQLDFVTAGPYSSNVGSRTYLMDTEDKYYMFKLKNKEFTFDVDVSQLGCGLNGALYFVQMDEDGGLSKYPSNKAGAKYGTGYCDAQCPHDLKFINGEPNILDWTPSSTDPNAGTGKYGTCCVEMDIW
jgi:cellulose 1,4-beta-cellobiosidase